ncbi:MAG: hypothetical protein WA718_08430 [Terriglobales bacterium]
MDTNKAAYWIALGVLALGLNSEYRHGNFVAVHRVADRAGSLLCRVATRAERTLAVARILTTREAPADDLFAARERAEMARVESELLREQARDKAELLRDMVRDRVRDEVRAQADLIRAHAEIHRAEMEQIRFRARSEFRLAGIGNRRVVVVCPQTGERITVNAGPDSADALPDIVIADNL